MTDEELLKLKLTYANSKTVFGLQINRVIDELTETRRERDAYKADADKEWGACATERHNLKAALATTRAAMAEEAANIAETGDPTGYGDGQINNGPLGDSIGAAIRALAPLPPSVRCVSVETLERVVEEADYFLTEFGCKNGCAPDDMTCDTQRFRAAIAELSKEKA